MSETIPKFVSLVENSFGLKVKTLHSDGGGGFDNNAMTAFCQEKGIRRKFTAAGTSEQNGQVERMNRTLGEAIHAIGLRDAQ